MTIASHFITEHDRVDARRARRAMRPEHPASVAR
jgi:hypothetical protein